MDFANLENQLRDWLKQVNLRQHGTTKQVPEERFKVEQEHLLALPAKDYDTTLPLAINPDYSYTRGIATECHFSLI